MEEQEKRKELIQLYESLTEEAQGQVLAFVKRLSFEFEQEVPGYDEDLYNPSAKVYSDEEIFELLEERSQYTELHPESVLDEEQSEIYFQQLIQNNGSKN